MQFHIRTVRRTLSRFAAYNAGRQYLAEFDRDLSIFDVNRHYPDLALQYRYFRQFFWHQAPPWLRDHRRFFTQEQRGFGENAFHAMWYLLFRDLRPTTFVEIGVYRGQVFTLAKLLSQRFGIDTAFLAISPFDNSGDLTTAYGNHDYYRDVRSFAERFGVSVADAELCRALSTDPAAIAALSSQPWDVAYIDGSHDYEIVCADFQNVSANLAPQGVIVMDDAGLYSGYQPGRFSFAGHPGPSRVLREALSGGWRRLAQVGHNVILRRA
jgi:hypothetical protein